MDDYQDISPQKLDESLDGSGSSRVNYTSNPGFKINLNPSYTSSNKSSNLPSYQTHYDQYSPPKNPIQLSKSETPTRVDPLDINKILNQINITKSSLDQNRASYDFQPQHTAEKENDKPYDIPRFGFEINAISYRAPIDNVPLESPKDIGIEVSAKTFNNPTIQTIPINRPSFSESSVSVEGSSYERPSISQVEDKSSLRIKDSNPMFWSTMSGTQQRYSAPQRVDLGTNYFAANDPREERKREINKLFQPTNILPNRHTIDDSSSLRSRDKRENPLYWSTAQPYQKNNEVKIPEGNIFEEFLLPRGVGKILEAEEENINLMEHHITQQKYKVSIDIDQIMEEISEVLIEYKQQIYDKFDQYLLEYKKNYSILREKVTQYKERAKEFFYSKESKDRLLNPQQSFNPVMKAIQFYKVDPQSHTDGFFKFKEEACDVQGNASSINREVSKRLIGFLSDELTKQTSHKPLYNHTESLQSLFIEIKDEITSKVRECMASYPDDMVYIVQPEKFSGYFAFPKIESVVSDDNLNIIGDSEKLLSMKLNLEKEVVFEPENKCLCLRVISSDHIAAGCSDGSIKLYNYQTNTLTTNFKGHGTSITTMEIMKVQAQDLNDIVLLTGSAQPECSIRAWQLPSQKCVRNLKGHKESITSLLPMKDGTTLLSASQENHILIWNMVTGKLFNKVTQHTKAINGLHLIKDNSRFLSISDDGTIVVWKIIYAYSNELQRRVFSSCEVDKVFEDVCEITSINSSTDNYNIIITGGKDSKIKIWNIEKNQCIKEVVGHGLGVGATIFFENPFKIESYEKYLIMSMGYMEECLKIAKSSSSYAEVIVRDSEIYIDRAGSGHYKMQLVKSKGSDALKLFTISNRPGKGFMIWNVE